MFGKIKDFFKGKKEPGDKRISIRYFYEWKEDVPESERDTIEHPSRPFCKKLLELNRLYTRADIEKISARLGYSVFDRCGGDGCRHRWVSTMAVTKK